jgi:RNA polymerase sigma-70 factor (ECF subfamily)
MRIATNMIIDDYRKNSKHKTISRVRDKEGTVTDIFDVLKIKEKNVEDEMVKRHTHCQVRQLIERLPFEQKEVVMLRHYYDMSFQEISELTRVNINTALGRMRYALINLRKIMERENITL